jgi:hypothetical protein
MDAIPKITLFAEGLSRFLFLHLSDQLWAVSHKQIVHEQWHFHFLHPKAHCDNPAKSAALWIRV